MAIKNPFKSVPVRKLVKEAQDVAGASGEDVLVDVCVDLSTPRPAIEEVERLFSPVAENGHVHVEGFYDVAYSVSPQASLLVVVANESQAVSRTVAEAVVADKPVVVCAFDPVAVLRRSQTTSFPLEASDIVGMDAERAFSAFGDRLAAWIVDNCPDARLALSSAFEFLRKPLANEYMKRTAAVAGAVGAAPFIPGSDMPALFLLQGAMIARMGAAYGDKPSAQTALELAAALPAGFGGRALARALVKKAPNLAFLSRGAVAYGVTMGLGAAMGAFFARGGMLKSVSEALSRVEAAVDGTPLAGAIAKALGASAGEDEAAGGDGADAPNEADGAEYLAALGLSPDVAANADDGARATGRQAGLSL